MKVTELYDQVADQVDELQRQLVNILQSFNRDWSEPDPSPYVRKLKEKQGIMKQLMQLAVKEGDRELTAEELTAIGV